MPANYSVVAYIVVIVV